MDQRADDGIQRPDDGQRDGDEVERHGEGQVELDGGHHPPGEGHEMRQLLHRIIHQRDIRGVHGDITAHAAHGDADVRLFECRRIVHAVADHADRHALRLIVPDGVQLILRQAVCPRLADLQLPGDGPGCVFVVAGQQDRLHTEIGQDGDGLRAFLPQRVGQSEKTGKAAVYRHIRDLFSIPYWVCGHYTYGGIGCQDRKKNSRSIGPAAQNCIFTAYLQTAPPLS